MNHYMKITLTNTEPLTIADIYNSKSDEAVALPAINGAAVRGALMNRLAAEGKLEAVKRAFFDGSICFLPANPMLCYDPEKKKKEEDSKKEKQESAKKQAEKPSDETKAELFETIPVPKGFYEKKQSTGKILHTFLRNSKEIVNLEADYCQGQEGDEKTDEEKRGPFFATKRAKVGKFASIKENALLYTSPDMGETFKIRLARNQMEAKPDNEKTQKLFRGDYLEKDQIFIGYIAFRDSCSETVRSLVEEAIRKPGLRLGGSRSSGYGAVHVTDLCWLEEGTIPFESLSCGGNVRETEKQSWYMDMLCLSPLCMFNEYGEPCGVDEDQLAVLLGLSEGQVRVTNSSTSVTHVCGFNRMAGGRSAEYPVFEAGSIFRLSCAAKPSAEKMREMEDIGLGILREEGLGRILFVTDIEAVTEKKECKPAFVEETEDTRLTGTAQYETDMKQMKRQAAASILNAKLENASYDYILNNPFPRGNASRSQRSNVLILCKSLRYTPGKAIQEFENYFAHIEEKEKRSRVHSTSHGSQLTMRDGVMRILQSDITELLFIDEKARQSICEVPTRELLNSDQEMKYKLNLIEEMIRYANRKESADEES